MSNTEKQSTTDTADITTLENHAPILPALSELKKPEAETPGTSETSGTAEPVAEGEIVAMENHAPAPPALDLDGGGK